MPMYQYECDGCGDILQKMMTFDEHENDRSIPLVHGNCPSPARGKFLQVYDFHFNKGMRDHWSSQLNKPVSSERQFNSELSRHQDEYSARMGYDVNFETVDPNDRSGLNVTDVGIDADA